jgi:hypothetical protein
MLSVGAGTRRRKKDHVLQAGYELAISVFLLLLLLLLLLLILLLL